MAMIADLAAPPDIGAATCARRCSTIECVRDSRTETIVCIHTHLHVHTHSHHNRCLSLGASYAIRAVVLNASSLFCIAFSCIYCYALRLRTGLVKAQCTKGGGTSRTSCFRCHLTSWITNPLAKITITRYHHC